MIKIQVTPLTYVRLERRSYHGRFDGDKEYDRTTGRFSIYVSDDIFGHLQLKIEKEGYADENAAIAAILDAQEK